MTFAPGGILAGSGYESEASNVSIPAAQRVSNRIDVAAPDPLERGNRKATIEMFSGKQAAQLKRLYR